jgi:hypothetical protein
MALGIKIEEDHCTQPENKLPFFAPQSVCIPVAVSAFPHEQLYQAPRSWAERAYPKRIYYKKHDKGGHFAAREQAHRLTEDLRAGFRLLRNRKPLVDRINRLLTKRRAILS